MNKTLTLLCATGVTGVAMMTPSAAYATQDGARADANALTATILGQSGDTGEVRASNNGSGEKKTNDTVNPPVNVLTGQPYAGIGVLAQDATASNSGKSAACSGIAGDGGAANVIEVGDSSCLTPGSNVNLELANLQLNTLLSADIINNSGSLGTLLTALGAETGGAAVVDQLTAGLQAAVDELEANLGNAGLRLDAGAIEASCNYNGTSSTGRTVLARGDVRLVIPQVGAVSLTDGFDPSPAPNTHVIAQADEVLALILDDLRDALNDELDAITNPLFADIIDPVQTQVVAQIVAQFEPALLAVQDNLLDVTLNKQTRSGRSIEVTGVSIQALQGAQQFGAPVVVDVNIANVGCGPAAGVAGRPPVPTSVDAGTDGDGQGGMYALFAATLAALGLGVARARRVARR